MEPIFIQDRIYVVINHIIFKQFVYLVVSLFYSLHLLFEDLLPLLFLINIVKGLHNYSQNQVN
jgi:hypothetical protein